MVKRLREELHTTTMSDGLSREQLAKIMKASMKVYPCYFCPGWFPSSRHSQSADHRVGEYLYYKKVLTWMGEVTCPDAALRLLTFLEDERIIKALT